MEKQKFAVLVAGGSGNRMGSEVPKQFLLLNGKPILLHTIEQFAKIAGIKIILVLPEKDIEYWYEITQQYSSASSIVSTVKIVKGGKSRFQSVKNGLKSVAPDSIVAIHDGVRPLISIEIIEKSFNVANESGNAVTCVQLKDSIREIGEMGENKAVERKKFRLMQTPQTFQSEIITKAFETIEQPFFTDCASVLEFAGFSINLIEGSYENIKITTPEDLLIAEALLKSR
ncbi:2-C-methyl-D-erythritol 4-phosphate cytidylyltransferase [Emticicia sp. BO119]|uniref:2-C-methyl-D-erythritol 4-phosphate cytidylyltransferase n=1 Tax=Emticicia sp. BO119 TaxID=2757768 RepID=UPI0015F06E14|nr:2-C-methyl-D-erythritol 4-phosphate cytidylyltransferase [Emticicia sp. BO119]MBA4850038.1 2-C-methyl-D-erythritol 4-phosphate cytidylyltransferase [Emticicia sp. BO119]